MLYVLGNRVAGKTRRFPGAATRRLPPIYLFQRGNEYFIYHRDLLVFVGLFENVEDS
jgi:hypothetical protein